MANAILYSSANQSVSLLLFPLELIRINLGGAHFPNLCSINDLLLSVMANAIFYSSAVQSASLLLFSLESIGINLVKWVLVLNLISYGHPSGSNLKALHSSGNNGKLEFLYVCKLNLLFRIINQKSQNASFERK